MTRTRVAMQSASPVEIATSQPSVEGDHAATSKEKYMRSTASSSTDSAITVEISVQAAAAPAVQSDACRSNTDCDDSASTAASDIEEREADFLCDSDDAEDAQEGGQPGSRSSKSAACAAAAVAASLPSATAARKTKWADLADDHDEDTWGGTAWAHQKDTCALKAKPTARPVVDGPPLPTMLSDFPAARSARTRDRDTKQEKQKLGKRGTWVQVASAEQAEPLQETPDRAQQKVAAKQSKTQKHEAWWSDQQHSGNSSWWSSSDASWWSSNQQDDWWSRQFDSTRAKWSQQTERRGTTTCSAKPQCQFFIGIEEDGKFKVTRRVLGLHGQHMKAIAEVSGAKLRLRGRGSGFLEGPEQQESTDDLMLCVSAPDQVGYTEAVRLVRELMERVYEEYRVFCRNLGRALPELEVRVHEGPRPGSR